MTRAHIYVKPVTKCEQLTTNNTTRLTINAIIFYSQQPLVHTLMDLFRGNSLLSVRTIFSKNSFASFNISTLVNPGARSFLLHVCNVRVTINKMICKN